MRKSMTVIMALTLSVGFSAASGMGSVRATEGWTKINEKWRYYDQNDQPITLIWKKSKDYWYYLSGDGTILKHCVFRDKNSIYYVDEGGKMVQNIWIYADAGSVAIDGSEEGRYYFGADGKGYRRKNSSFKRNIGGSIYIFDENGKMLPGWSDEDGNPTEDSDTPLIGGVYYAREDGRLLAGEWLDYGEINEGIGDSDLDSEVAGRNCTGYDKMWIFFDSHPKKVKSNGDRLRQKTISGAKYGFDESGIMIPWWSKVASTSNADKSNSSSDVSTRYYSGYDGGALLKDSWFWMYPSENLDMEDYYDQECSWWRTNERGEVYRNRICKINGRSYAFDGIGRMQTGFVLFDEKSKPVARYEADDRSSEDFIEGTVYGIEKSDSYLFSPDELNDGSMQIGEDIAVELEDGVSHFGFTSNGKAFGNQDRLRKEEGMYYINSLRLETDEEYGYGVAKVEDGADTYYQVVDTRGKMIEGKKKIVKDKGGGYLFIIRNRSVAWCGDGDKPRWGKGEEGTGFYHYDRGNKEDHFAGGLIAAAGMEPNIDGLPEKEWLNS